MVKYAFDTGLSDQHQQQFAEARYGVMKELLPNLVSGDDVAIPDEVLMAIIYDAMDAASLAIAGCRVFEGARAMNELLAQFLEKIEASHAEIDERTSDLKQEGR